MNPMKYGDHRSRKDGLGLMLGAALAAVAGFSTGASAQTLTTIFAFSGGDGASPTAGLIADASGALYGTTPFGGASLGGTVFKLTPSATTPWPETVLHSFDAFSGDGGVPEAGLIADASGALYGTTVGGGHGHTFGTVFKLTPNGAGTYTETFLHSFSGSDGEGPASDLIADASGALYSTTAYGGSSAGCPTSTAVFPSGCGTVFKLTPNGDGTYTESLLYSFGGPDGNFPAFAGLIADASGALYGTTQNGGNLSGCPGDPPVIPPGCGTVFKLTPNGAGTYTETVLHSFSGSDGAEPFAGLIADASGALYGTTEGGGSSGEGTVFKLTPNGDGTYTESLLHSFSGSDGASPRAGLIADASGALYGTTAGGGVNNRGTVFKLMPNGAGTYTETVLHSFSVSGSDGAQPTAGLIADASGALYGTTYEGGASDVGTVFKLTGSGFLPPTIFAGTPGTAKCFGKSISSLARRYHGMAHAAATLGYASVTDLRSAVAAFCAG